MFIVSFVLPILFHKFIILEFNLLFIFISVPGHARSIVNFSNHILIVPIIISFERFQNGHHLLLERIFVVGESQEIAVFVPMLVHTKQSGFREI